ncbi:hypothetical protein [Glaciecola sp. SC05]|uniref:hypothetical protein n=1 Tax=Glaciecola sp. SC05 TaxID=1987355 RepID=UPI003529568E
MNVDKAKKLIAKQVKKGDKGYPKIAIEYFGASTECATHVALRFTLEEGAEVQEEVFSSKTDVRESEVIQSAIVKVIQRADAKTVVEVQGVSAL